VVQSTTSEDFITFIYFPFILWFQAIYPSIKSIFRVGSGRMACVYWVQVRELVVDVMFSSSSYSLRHLSASIWEVKTLALHKGQSGERSSHSLRHGAWKVWLSLHFNATTWPAALPRVVLHCFSSSSVVSFFTTKSSRHMAQVRSSNFSSSLSRLLLLVLELSLTWLGKIFEPLQPSS